MTKQEHHGKASASAGEGLEPGELEKLTTAIDTRFAPHLEAASATVRAAERAVTESREALERAQRRAESRRYVSDPLVFMRQTVEEEVEALERKTTPKNARAGYRFLMERAVDLAAAEVKGYQTDQEDLQRDLVEGVAACESATVRAEEALAQARVMQERIQEAERAARTGLEILLPKLTDGPE